jgi:NAD-dependent dihydropyrimidine dehydrogenase PreA subunit
MDRQMNKAIQTCNFFKAKGMNRTGLRHNNAITLYKSFIRPQFEYGMALQIIPSKTLKAVQKIQNRCLRTIFSCAQTTSINALHRISGIDKVQTRNEVLHAKYWNRIEALGKTEQGLKAYLHVKIWDNQKKTMGNKDMVFKTHVLQNKLIQSIKSRDSNQKSVQDVIMQYRLTQIRGEDGPETIAGVIAQTDMKMIPMLQAGTWLTRDQVHILLLWRFGTLSRHEECVKCGREMTRDHVLHCSNGYNIIQEMCQTLTVEIPQGWNPLDVLLNTLTYKQKNRQTEEPLLATVFEVLHSIEKECLGCERISEEARQERAIRTSKRQSVTTTTKRKTNTRTRQVRLMNSGNIHVTSAVRAIAQPNTSAIRVISQPALLEHEQALLQFAMTHRLEITAATNELQCGELRYTILMDQDTASRVDVLDGQAVYIDVKRCWDCTKCAEGDLEEDDQTIQLFRDWELLRSVYHRDKTTFEHEIARLKGGSVLSEYTEEETQQGTSTDIRMRKLMGMITGDLVRTAARIRTQDDYSTIRGD